jgi:hypothetical protein
LGRRAALSARTTVYSAKAPSSGRPVTRVMPCLQSKRKPALASHRKECIYAGEETEGIERRSARQRELTYPMTRSPFLKRCTSGPTAYTVLATSLPIILGHCFTKTPASNIQLSTWLMPTTTLCTTSSPSPGGGIGASLTSRGDQPCGSVGW